METAPRSQWLRSAAGVLFGLPRWPLFALVFLSLSGVVWIFAPRSIGEPLSFLAIFVGGIVAGLTFIMRSRLLVGRERRAWTLVGWGFTVGSFGMIALAVTAAIQGDAPAFGPADVIFILGYLGVLIGFASLPHTSGTRLVRVRTGLDGLIGAVAIGALLLTFVLDTVVAGAADAPVWESLVGVAYPLVDLAALVVFMIVTVRQSVLRFDLRIMLLATGIFVQAIADVQFLVAGVGNSIAEAQPPQLLYMFAIGCYVATSAIVDRVPPAREYADRRPPLWAFIAPYGAAAAMVLILLARLWDANIDSGDRVLLIAVFVVGVLVIARQGIAIRENRMIVERQRSDLVSSISHELRTPLTAMIGFVAVLQEDPKLHLDERIEMIDVVAEQGAHLERVVEDLLVLAHDDPSRVGLTTAEHPIGPIVKSAIRSAGCEPPRGTTEIEPGLTAVVDDGRIVPILVNLLSNAQRYGGDTCLIVAKSDGTRLIIEVHDSGSGVPKKYELTIWERFERGPNRYNASIPGSGIGLAMVRTIAEAHGGRVGYRESERLGGACFSINLPGIVGRIEPTVMAPSATLAIG